MARYSRTLLAYSVPCLRSRSPSVQAECSKEAARQKPDRDRVVVGNFGFPSSLPKILPQKWQVWFRNLLSWFPSVLVYLTGQQTYMYDALPTR